MFFNKSTKEFVKKGKISNCQLINYLDGVTFNNSTTLSVRDNALQRTGL
jgi:hypothetical protein